MPLYQFSASARREIRGIVSYIKKDNPSAAEKWFSTLHKKCSTLCENPRIGRVRDDLFPDAYMFPFGNYLIFYDIIPDGINIVHVADARQDVRSALAGKGTPEAVP